MQQRLERPYEPGAYQVMMMSLMKNRNSNLGVHRHQNYAMESNENYISVDQTNTPRDLSWPPAVDRIYFERADILSGTTNDLSDYISLHSCGS